MRFAPAIALCLLLAGCGPPLVWDRPQTAAADLQLDLRECRGMARQQAFAESWPSFYSPYGFYRHGFYDRRGGFVPYAPFGGPFGDPFLERDFREASLHEFCMKARGYRLTPAPQVKTAPQAKTEPS